MGLAGVVLGIAKGRSNKEIGDDLEANDRTYAAMIALKRGLIR